MADVLSQYSSLFVSALFYSNTLTLATWLRRKHACTPDAQSHVIVMKQVTPSGSRIGNVATKCSFGASRQPEPAFTRDGRARLRPQRATVLDHTLPSTQCTSLKHCATAFLLVSLRSRVPWTTSDSVGSTSNLPPNWCHAQLAKALSQMFRLLGENCSRRACLI